MRGYKAHLSVHLLDIAYVFPSVVQAVKADLP